MLEESITDWMLDFFDMMDPEITYYGWNRQQEGRVTGADWDWWFLSGEQAFALRVQAKKIYHDGSDHYAGLARSNKTGMQIDKLLSSSQQCRLYPVYAIYGDNKRKGRFVSNGLIDSSVSICSAQELYDVVFGVKRQKVGAEKLLQMSFPLQALFCQRLGAPRNAVGVAEFLRERFEATPRQPGEDGLADRRRGFFDRVPMPIRALAELRRSRENAASMAIEYQSKFAGSNGVVITNLDIEEEESDD